MNLIDLFVIIVVAISVLHGIYRGFINSVSRIGAFFLSWLSAFIFSPLISRLIESKEELFASLITYVEGAEKLGNVENAKLLVDKISSADLNAIITNANFPQPFPALIKENVLNKAFADKGLATLGEYTNYTVVCTIVNILCFLIVFMIATVIFSFVINALDKTIRFPVLKQFDGLLGGGFGLILGCFSMFVIFLVVPIILVLMDIKYISEYLNNSFLGTFFYKYNFILNFIRGVI